MSEPADAQTAPVRPHDGSSTSRRGGADAEAAMKGLAKSMAKDAAAQISDRHLRAQVRTSCYNQMVNVLRVLDGRLAEQRMRHRRVTTILGAVIVVLASALAVSLLV